MKGRPTGRCSAGSDQQLAYAVHLRDVGNRPMEGADRLAAVT
jgi:hypothetical protein